MKLFFALILSFFVFTETVIPCCLWDDCKQEESVLANNKGKKPLSDCSPFAACSTCVTTVIISTLYTVTFSTPELTVTHTSAPQNFIVSSYNKSLLQPPRLS